LVSIRILCFGHSLGQHIHPSWAAEWQATARTESPPICMAMLTN
jgi:hypothetical protein